MITTKQIQATLETDNIIREYRDNTMFWFNDDKTRFISYGTRWGWGVHHYVLHHYTVFSGKGKTLEEALAILDLEKLAFDLL